MITPMDIHNKTFSRGLRGYSQEEVDAFLEELASDYERIYREHRMMEEEMDTIRTKLRNYEKMEATMSSTLVMAQETAENVKKNAAKEAELSVREAHTKAGQIVADAEAARRKLNEDMLKTEGDLKLYIEQILTNFKSAMKLIETAKETPVPEIIPEVPTAGETQVPEELPEEIVDDRSANLFEVADEESAAKEKEELMKATEEAQERATNELYQKLAAPLEEEKAKE